MTEIFTGGEIVTLDPVRPGAEAVAVHDGVIVGINDKQTVSYTHLTLPTILLV